MSESDSSGENKIEKVEAKLILDDTVNYIVKYKNIRTCMAVTLDQLNKSEKKFIERYEKHEKLLNQKKEKQSVKDRKSESIISQNKKIRYNNEDDSEIILNNKRRYNKDEDFIIPQDKKIEYSNDEESNILLNNKRKYISDEEESIIPQNKKGKYKDDEESVKSQSSSSQNFGNKFNKKYKEHYNKENKKIHHKQNSFDYNFDDNNDMNDFSMSSKFEREGILLDDIPLKILNVGTKNKNDKNLFCLVRWKQSNKDIRILDSIIDINKIKKACPGLLIDFYESKIIFSQDLDD